MPAADATAMASAASRSICSKRSRTTDLIGRIFGLHSTSLSVPFSLYTSPAFGSTSVIPVPSDAGFGDNGCDEEEERMKEGGWGREDEGGEDGGGERTEERERRLEGIRAEGQGRKGEEWRTSAIAWRTMENGGGGGKPGSTEGSVRIPSFPR